MRRLRYPRGGFGRAFQSNVRAKRGPRKAILVNLVGPVRSRYAEYISKRRTTETVNALNWTAVEREALEHCYTSSTFVTKGIKRDVIDCLSEDEIALCPYCLIRSPEHLDHFLPISRYPEFSTFSPNLIWVCGRCNITKGDGLTQHPRAVLNPYFDAIPTDTALLYCQVTAGNGRLGLNFFVPNGIPGVSQGTITIAKRHCVEFSLFDAYMIEGSALVAELLRELASRFPEGLSVDDLQNEIRYQQARQPRGEPVNYWRSAVWEGLAACPDFHDYVQQFIVDNQPPLAVHLPQRPRFAHLINWV